MTEKMETWIVVRFVQPLKSTNVMYYVRDLLYRSRVQLWNIARKTRRVTRRILNIVTRLGDRQKDKKRIFATCEMNAMRYELAYPNMQYRVRAMSRIGIDFVSYEF